jgi:hypothetical protein
MLRKYEEMNAFDAFFGALVTKTPFMILESLLNDKKVDFQCN